MTEHGGNTVIDFEQKTVSEGQSTTGGYNFIKLPRGLIDWHSHPGKCKNDNTCAIGIPSPADLKNIIIGAVYGTQAHLVYAQEGTYLVQVDMCVTQRLQKSPCAMKEALCIIDKVFMNLHQKHVDNKGANYTKYRHIWMAVAEYVGFVVKFFEKDELPMIPLFMCCGLDPSKHPQVERVIVPPKKQRDAEQAHCNTCENIDIDVEDIIKRATAQRPFIAD